MCPTLRKSTRAILETSSDEDIKNLRIVISNASMKMISMVAFLGDPLQLCGWRMSSIGHSWIARVLNRYIERYDKDALMHADSSDGGVCCRYARLMCVWCFDHTTGSTAAAHGVATRTRSRPRTLLSTRCLTQCSARGSIVIPAQR